MLITLSGKLLLGTIILNRIAWLTDIHLNFLSASQLETFYKSLQNPDIDSIFISGDIGEAPTLRWFLESLNKLGKPIYFVLGNHDYYFSSFEHVQRMVKNLVRELTNLVWLTDEELVQLSPTTALIGHDSWADGRYGDFMSSPVILNDYVLIQDFVGLFQAKRYEMLNRLGDAAANYLEKMLSEALSRYELVFVVTHVPPFQEATKHRKQNNQLEFLPHYSCKAVGDVLIQAATQYPDKQIIVLCGHTHTEASVQILDNLRVFTGYSEYGTPQICQVFEIY